MAAKEECQPRTEVYFFDLEGAQNEEDDPMKAVLFYWPKSLSEDHVILTAGHLAAVFQFFDQKMYSSSESETEAEPLQQEDDSKEAMPNPRLKQTPRVARPGIKTGRIDIFNGGSCYFGILDHRHILFVLSTPMPKSNLTMVHSSVSVKEMCDLSKVLFEDTFQAADFVYGGLQNLMKREGNCASRIFLEQFMSIRSGHEKLSISNEVLMLCKDLMNLCRKGLRRVSHLIVGGIFYNASQASEGLGQLVYLSNPSKEFERVFSWLHLVRWEEDPSSRFPIGVSLPKIHYERSIWNLFENVAQETTRHRQRSSPESSSSESSDSVNISLNRCCARQRSSGHQRKPSRQINGQKLVRSLQKFVMHNGIALSCPKNEVETLHSKDYCLYGQQIANVRLVLIFKAPDGRVLYPLLSYIWGVSNVKLPSIKYHLNPKSELKSSEPVGKQIFQKCRI